ncbi:N-acetylmuramoyl-L-alanine amidase [Tropicibacter alexandrii]|uniref:peptidoglycan recognition protein family protein n=1 Tax=Tropicibacter alexandrii TaxID=2267683 RepID=UPI000EF50211|nr:N-acetylmuramoyl-L-alanine amidase [Tropicibacter alexandrii]
MRALMMILCLLGGLAHAEPAQLHVAGEIAPGIKTIDQGALRAQEHDRITHITFHHEGFAGSDADLFAKASRARQTQSITQRVLNINHYHATDAGLGMIAYHYVVAPSGEIAKARPVKYKPATMSTEWGSSQRADFEGHFAVMALGDFNHESLTPAARLSMIQVMSEAQRAYRVPTHLIQPHRAHANTSCPGETMLAEADELALRVTVYSVQTELSLRGCDVAADGIAGTATRKALVAAGLPGAGDVTDTVLFRLIDNPDLHCM